MGDNNVWLAMNGEMLIQKMMFGVFTSIMLLTLLLLLLYLLVSI